MISSPPTADDQTAGITLTANDVSTATTGAKLTYTCPSGKAAVLQAGSAMAVTGTTQTVQLQLVTSGNTIALTQAIVNQTVTQKINLSAGDQLVWNCIGAVAATTDDFTITVNESFATGRITLSFNGPAVLDKGITLHPGGDPLELLYEHIGQAIREEVRAISDGSTVTIGILEILEMDCDCLVGQQIERRQRY